MASVGYAFALLFGLATTIANPILYTSLNESFRTTLAIRSCCGRRGRRKDSATVALAHQAQVYRKDATGNAVVARAQRWGPK
jgi:hypothetical protein